MISGEGGGWTIDVGLRLDLKSLTTTCIDSPTARLKFDNFSLCLRARDARGRRPLDAFVVVELPWEVETGGCDSEVEGAG